MKSKFETTIRKFDETITHLVGRLPDATYAPFITLGRLVEPINWFIALTILLLTAVIFGRTDIAQLLAITLAVLPISSIIKLFVRRRRPKSIKENNIKIKSYSFPSSHAYSSFVCVSVLSSILVAATNAAALYIIGLLLIITIGVSRVRIGVHYPSDVLGGWLLATLAVLLITALPY